jgi:hypothetical protein
MTVPIWPSGVARLADGILEVTTGEGIRVSVDDIVTIELEPPAAGRFSLKVAYRAGLGKHKTSFWVEPEHEDAARQLVASVTEREVFGHRVLGFRIAPATGGA